MKALVVAGVILSLGLAGSAYAQNNYSVTGNSRNQIGNGLPLPITLAPPPNGAFPLTGTIQQGLSSDPKKMIFPAGGQNYGPNTLTIGLFGANSNVFQVQTSLIVNAPKSNATFQAGGRTGPSVFTWCPGLPLPTGTVNPSCTIPTTATTGTALTVRASIRYEKTLNQFGGVSQPSVDGNGPIVSVPTGGGGSTPIGNRAAVVALRPPQNAGGAPCDFTVTPTCVAAFDNVVAGGTGVVGGPIGFSAIATAQAPVIYQVKIAAPGTTPLNFLGGRITSVGPQAGVFPVGNAVRSYGGPWTTGKVTVKAPDSAETFFLQGADNRVNGIGSISLVAGGVSNRTLSGDNANRGWINMDVQQRLVPVMPTSGLVLLAALLAGGTILMIRRAATATS